MYLYILLGNIIITKSVSLYSKGFNIIAGSHHTEMDFKHFGHVLKNVNITVTHM